MVNGKGMVNGQGMTNGRAFTNGKSFTNGQGAPAGTQTAGHGRIDEEGFIDGRGLVDAKGLIDGDTFDAGKGLVDGRKLMYTDALRRKRKKSSVRRIAAVAVAVAIVITVLPLLYMYQSGQVYIDGVFNDWNDVPKFVDVVEASPQINADIDIAEYAVKESEDALNFYVKVAGRMMAGKATDRGADGMQVFLDTDRNAATGYQVYGVGADYMIEMAGWGGNVHQASFSAWEGGAGTDLINFASRGAVRVATSGDRLEGQIRFAEIDVASSKQPVRAELRLSNSKGEEDWADAAINQFPAAVSLRYTQPQTGNTLNLLATAHHDNITIDRITVHFESYTGASAMGRAEIIAQGRTYPGSGPGPTSVVSFIPSLTIPAATQGIMLQVQSTSLLGALAVRPAILFSNDIEARAERYNIVETSVKPAPGYTYLSTSAVPSGDIRIDGSFDDWAALGGLTGEAGGDVRNRLADNPYGYSNPNVDITGYQVKLTPTGGATHASFAIRTRGHMMGGLVVDNPVGPTVSEPSIPGGGGAAPTSNYLEDRAIIYIDRDPKNDPKDVTGVLVVTNQPLFGADFFLDIGGKMGRVIGSLSKLYEYQLGTGWREVQGFAVTAATDYSNLETKVPLINLGMSPAVRPSVYYVTSDWRGNYDETPVYSNRGPTAARLYADERSVAPFSVGRGDEDVPILRLDLENREDEPAEVGTIYANVVGTATAKDIGAVRAWVASRTDEGFDPGTAREVTNGNAWDGNEVALGMSMPLTVGPRSALSVFLTVDILRTATTLQWFDLWVLNVGGLITNSEVIMGEVHSSYKLVRIWNESGGRGIVTTLAINEVYPHPSGGAGDTKEWIELINPTGSEITLTGYYLYLFRSPSKQWTLLNFTSSDKIAGSKSVKIWEMDDNGELEDSCTIYLYDNNDNAVDTFIVPSVSNAYSRARFRDASDNPLETLYTDSSPTNGTKNDLIPEFRDIVYPLMGTLVIYAVVRRRSYPKGIKQAAVVASLQAARKPFNA